MAKSQLTGSQIKDGTITRDDINVTTTGKSVVAKLTDGTNGVKIDTYSGADIGTGDVSLKVDLSYLDTKYPSLLTPRSQNLFFASPAVGSGNPTFRTLTSGDIPVLPYVTSNTSQTGLIGDKTTSGNWTFNRVSANSIQIQQSGASLYSPYVGIESKSSDGNTIYLGGVADTVGSYIGQARYISSNQYQSNKTYSSFIKFGNAGDIYFYGNTGLTTNTNYSPTELAKIDSTGRFVAQSIVKAGGLANQFLKADGSVDSNTFAVLNHTHTIAQVTGLQSALDSKVDDSQVLTNVPSGALFTDTVYVHPTTSGNKHIPSGGSANQILRWSADGTAVWSAENNTTYTAGNGLTLTGTVFSLPITVSGSGNYITDVTQNANGITVTKGTLPTYVTQASLTTQLATKINALDNAVGIGFIGGSPDSPYIRNSIGFDSSLATTSWTSSNFVTFFSNQIITGIKTYTASPKVPFASQPDDAVPFGQAEEIAQARVNDTFAEVIYKNSANDLTFDFDDFPNVRFATITCKGNNFQNIRVENMPRGATLRILNGSASLSPIIYFDGGSNVTSLGSATWAEFYRDQDSDIFKNNVNGTNII